MIQKEQYTISSMMMRQLMDKYNSQNAKFNVEYIEAVLDEEIDAEFIGPRTLTLTESQNPYRGLWLRKHSEEQVVLISYIRLMKMHKDFCRVEIVYDDEAHFWASYEEFKRS